MPNITKKASKAVQGCAFAAFAFGAAAVTTAETASGQEILLTGPLAGAPAVRQLRQYRDKRFSVGPQLSFTLLDNYQRTMVAGLSLNYNFNDWLAAGVWGGWGALHIPTSLTDETQDVNAQRHADGDVHPSVAPNLGDNFADQLGRITFVIAPQVTVIPFRGKIALFQEAYLDTDLYFFAGPAIVGISDRKDCGAAGQISCTDPTSFDLEGRVAVTPTFGLGITLYVNHWNSVVIEWRALPVSINTSGFSKAPDRERADAVVNEDDRSFEFQQMVSIGYNFYFPQLFHVSE